MISRIGLVGMLVATASLPLHGQSVDAPPDEVRFVVLGHLRGDRDGDLNPKLDELLEEVQTLDPAFAVLTGDLVWGDIFGDPPDAAEVRREWDALDGALARLNIPIYRVPGNHDISDLVTRDIWRERYGALPQVVTEAGLRLLLLSSAWTPKDGDDRNAILGRGVDLEPDVVRWLGLELSSRSEVPTFVFMHHLLWWEPRNGPWWVDVHPLLARAGVKAVFTGDYGPLKFSSLREDGVAYYQSSMEAPVSLRMLQLNPASRVLSAQFDNYLEVVVRGQAVTVRVHTIAETAGEFTPGRYNSIIHGPPPPVMDRLRDFLGSRNRIAAICVALSGAFFMGWWTGRRRRRNRSRA